MIKENIANKENQVQRILQQKPARKILNRVGKSILNQSPIRKRVEKIAQRNLEALSSFETLQENDQMIDLCKVLQYKVKQHKKKINFSQQEIVGWDEEKQEVQKPKKIMNDQSVQTSLSQEKTRKSITMQTQRIKTMPKLVETRLKTSKTPLRTTKITSPLIEYPTMQKLKLIFDNKMAKSGMKQIIICDRIVSSNGCLNGITLNNCATKTIQHKKNQSFSTNSKIQKVDIIKDLSFF